MEREMYVVAILICFLQLLIFARQLGWSRAMRMLGYKMTTHHIQKQKENWRGIAHVITGPRMGQLWVIKYFLFLAIIALTLYEFSSLFLIVLVAEGFISYYLLKNAVLLAYKQEYLTSLVDDDDYDEFVLYLKRFARSQSERS